MPGPRPLPLFLELVRRAAETDPELAAAALRGLAKVQQAPRSPRRQLRREFARLGAATLLDCGGSGRPIVLVPSLINPPDILDMDRETSLAEALTGSGRVVRLDWGPATARQALSIGDHIDALLIPLLQELSEPAVLIGYCLGGTMALAAASLTPTSGVATLASPWHFSAYPPGAIASLKTLWNDARCTVEQLGVLPIEVLQAAFWSLDPQRTVDKYAQLAELEADNPRVKRFIALEDWANAGEPLPGPAARELIEDLFVRDLPGRGEWKVGSRNIALPSRPTLHVTAANDRIVPAATVAPGPKLACRSGHVGMIVGREAHEKLHQPLREWLAALPEGS